MEDGTFVPALLVVDMQEDFCRPNGSLAVAGGRELAPIINELLQLPFSLKVATKDYHPADHISFTTSHSSPDNKPFVSQATIVNPKNPSETRWLSIWPVHCVQGTPGAEIIPEIDATQFDFIIEKGKEPKVEMYSGFCDIFGNKSCAASLDLAALLRQNGVTHTYTVGLAGDYCVKDTAFDAEKEGFDSCVIKEGTRSIDPGEYGWIAAVTKLQSQGVTIGSIDGPEIDRVKALAPR